MNVTTVGVGGAGTMGAGIAQIAALGGYRVAPSRGAGGAGAG